MMKKVTLLAPFILLSPMANALELDAKLKTRKALEGQPVLVTVSITNTQEDELSLPLLIDCQSPFLHLDVTDKKGNALPLLSSPTASTLNMNERQLQMPANSTFSRSIDLGKCFNLPRGKYSVSATYTVNEGNQLTESSWKGALTAKTTKLEIIRQKDLKKTGSSNKW